MDPQKTPPEDEKKHKHESPDHHHRHNEHGAARHSSKTDIPRNGSAGSDGLKKRDHSASPPHHSPPAHHGRHGSPVAGHQVTESLPGTPAAGHPHKLPSPGPEVKVQASKYQRMRKASTESQRLEKAVKISEIVRIPVPKVIVCRIFGVTSSESVGQLIYKYFVMKVPIYLSENWNDSAVEEAIGKIRDSIDESKVREFPVIPPASEPKERIIEAIVKFVEVMSEHKLDAQKKKVVNPSFIRLRSLIVAAGMRCKDIENSHVYDDIPPAFKVWKESGIRIATISSTTKVTQMDYMTYTNHGDLSAFISDTISLMNPHIQTADPKSPDFRNMCKKVLQVEPTSVLLLTSKIHEAKAAQKCSMEVLLICREERIGLKPLNDIKRDSVKDIAIVKSMQSIVLVK